MIFVFYLFSAALVFLSWRSFSGGVEYLRFFRRELARKPSGFAPRATVFVPCRGLDDGLEANLAPILRQDYPEYEVIFVVDSKTDAAVPVIERVLELEPGPSRRLFVAGEACGESQKVHNLRQAVTESSEGSEVFVFADSDVRPSENWLRALVGPLADDAVGCTTGYRWFISGRLGFASEMRSVWNASIASALGPNRSGNFCWGGSTAVRRATFERIGMRELWRGTLSDDFAMTRAMKSNGLGIVFVPQALTASVESCGVRELLEFTTRQMKITRVYQPHLWKMSLVGSTLFCFVMVWAAVIAVNTPFPSFDSIFATAMIAAVSTLSIGKSIWRLRAVRLVLEDYRTELNRQWLTQCTLWILSPALFFYNSVNALVSRRIVWRGIRYELRSPTETLVIPN